MNDDATRKEVGPNPSCCLVRTQPPLRSLILPSTLQVYDLLVNNYVEDDDEMFRLAPPFASSAAVAQFALLLPEGIGGRIRKDVMGFGGC